MYSAGCVKSIICAKGQGPDRYRFLIACAGLENLRKSYSFSLDPENILYDPAFTPKLRLRDGAKRGDGFAEDYKALIAAILAPKRSFADYKQGGGDLFKRNKLLKEISQLTRTDEIKSALKKALLELESKLAADSLLVSKRRYRGIQITMVVFICLFGALCAYAVRYYLVELPPKDTAIEVSNYFLAQNYIGVLHAIEGVELAALSKEERYMGAYAGAATASLNTRQRAAVMQAITLNTDSLYLDYWVCMGLGSYEAALDISRRMGDAELELYSLVIYRDAVSIDMNITGAEKAETLKNLDSQISALEKAVAEAAGGKD